MLSATACDYPAGPGPLWVRSIGLTAGGDRRWGSVRSACRSIAGGGGSVGSTEQQIAEQLAQLQQKVGVRHAEVLKHDS